MKALSLWQPWASLIAQEFKWVETRSWYTSFRGEILICSAKKKDKRLKEFHYSTIRPILRDLNPVMSQANWIDSSYRFFEYDDLPLGKALCVVNLKDCRKITPELIRKYSKREIAFGDWTEGRYAWIFDDIIPLNYKFPVTGKQGLFDVLHENLEWIVFNWFDQDMECTLFNMDLYDSYLKLASADVKIVFRGSRDECEKY